MYVMERCISPLLFHIVYGTFRPCLLYMNCAIVLQSVLHLCVFAKRSVFVFYCCVWSLLHFVPLLFNMVFVTFRAYCSIWCQEYDCCTSCFSFSSSNRSFVRMFFFFFFFAGRRTAAVKCGVCISAVVFSVQFISFHFVECGCDSIWLLLLFLLLLLLLLL